MILLQNHNTLVLDSQEALHSSTVDSAHLDILRILSNKRILNCWLKILSNKRIIQLNERLQKSWDRCTACMDKIENEQLECESTTVGTKVCSCSLISLATSDKDDRGCWPGRFSELWSNYSVRQVQHSGYGMSSCSINSFRPRASWFTDCSTNLWYTYVTSVES